MKGSKLRGFLSIIRFTMKKTLMDKRFFIVLGVIVFVCSVMGYSATQAENRLQFGSTISDVLIVSFIMPILAMVYGSSLIKDEIDDRSITQVLTSPMNRAVSYLAYYIALVISIVLILLLVTISGSLSYFIQLGLDQEALGIIGHVSLLVVVGSIVYSSLFIFVSILLDTPIYFGLFYAFIWEGFIGSLPGKIRLVAIKHYIRSLGSHWMEYGMIANYDSSTIGTSVMVLLSVTLSLLFLGLMVFRQKEFPQ